MCKTSVLDCLVFILFCLTSCVYCWKDTKIRRFKPGFMFGVTTAAYQIEGGWDADGKGESIWDHYLHLHPNVTEDHTNGDVATDSYHLYKRDVQTLRELGVDFYRLSVSWPRILPQGHSNYINEAGLQYYDNVIDEMLKYNIEPMLTMYHFDLPQSLQDLGGWANPLVVEWFEDYARVLFDRYASKVKFWITMNQPNFCMEIYNVEGMPPGVKSTGIGEYMCVKNVLVAHARAYRLYEKEYKKKYKGSVGIAISMNWFDPLNNQTDTVAAAEEAREFFFGIFLHPIYSTTGDYPPIVKRIVAKNSRKQGYPASRLPAFTAKQIKSIKGSSDFLAMNHYTTLLIERPKPNEQRSIYLGDANVVIRFGENWPTSRSPWLKSAPYGLYKACLHLNQQYNYPKIIVTENGWSTHAGLADETRIEYLQEYLTALLLAIEDGTEVDGYAVWSLMDNFEWLAGNGHRFGLYEVDYNAADKTRTPRHSAFYYRDLIESRIVDKTWKYKEGSAMVVSNRRLRKNGECKVGNFYNTSVVRKRETCKK